MPGEPRRRARPAIALLLALAGCRGDAPDAVPSAGAAPGAPAAPAAPGPVAPAAPGPPAAAPAAAAPTSIALEPGPSGDEARFLGDSGALAAWTAVLERGRLLARRGQSGAAWGRLDRREGGVWLLDETEQVATLGIRLTGAGGRPLAATAGARVVAWGAWTVDAQRRWVWRVDRMVALPRSGDAAAAGQPGAPLPILAADLAAPPDGAALPSARQKPGPVVFLAAGRPAKPGDGWPIADKAKSPPTALLVLPGEAAVYGGLDYLSPDERWALEPGQWYAVSVQVPNKSPRQGELPVFRARAAPARVPAPEPVRGARR